MIIRKGYFFPLEVINVFKPVEYGIKIIMLICPFIFPYLLSIQ